MNLKLLVLIFIPTLLWAKSIKVMEIDTGVSLSHPRIASHVKDSVVNSINYEDFVNHGTHIAGLILNKTCPQVEFISCRYIFNPNKGSDELYLKCIQRAIDEHVSIVNISSEGTLFWKEEYDLMLKLSNKNTKIVVAAGNWGKDYSQNCVDNYPACYKIKNMIVVGADDLIQSSYGIKGMVWEKGSNIESTFPNGEFGIMSGTSQATAIHTNRLLKEFCEKVK